MSFFIIGFYRPQAANDTFYDKFNDILKKCNHNKELIFMGDFNLNWDDKVKRKKLKTITDKYHIRTVIKRVNKDYKVFKNTTRSNFF